MARERGGGLLPELALGLRLEGSAGVLDASVDRRRIRILELIQRVAEQGGL